MYHSESGAAAAIAQAHTTQSATPDSGARRDGTRRIGARRIGTAVYLIGLTSLLTDISAEMVASILPVYLMTVLRLSPLEYGLIDGLYNGAAGIIRVAAAYVADFAHRHKTVAFAGYLLSALSKFALLFAGVAGWASVAGVILVDRIGKGIRTAPRDALIAAHAKTGDIGLAFGVHRALDAIGAIIGPLLATAILLWLPQRFDHVFIVSACFAVLGLLVFGTLVPKATTLQANPGRISLRAAATAFKAPRFLLLLAASTLLSLFTLSDSMIYLGLQRELGFDARYLPLLFVATACVFMALAIPVGRLADRIGHLKVFLFGYLMLALVYGLFPLLPAAGGAAAALYVILLGTYYAATDGVLAALAVRQLPPQMHATGIACLTTLTGFARMGSSILFGWAWETIGQHAAIGIFGGAMTVALVAAVAGGHYVERRHSITKEAT